MKKGSEHGGSPRVCYDASHRYLGLLLTKLLDEHRPIPVFEIRRVKISSLGLQEVLRDRSHFLRKRDWRNTRNVVRLAPHLVRVAQREPPKPLSHWLDQNGPLAI